MVQRNHKLLLSHFGAALVGLALGYQIPDFVASYRLKNEIDQIERKITQAPNSTDNWLLLGMVKRQAGDDVGALTAYKKSLDLNPSNLQAHRAMGDLYIRQDNLIEARKWFESALQLAKTNYPYEVQESEMFLKYLEIKEAK